MSGTVEVVPRVISDAAKARIERLREADPDRIITPEMLVADAEAQSSPLHDCLEWDNGEAGHQWRLHQARLILGRMRIKNVVEHTQTYNFTPKYVNVRVRTSSGGERRGYVPMARAMVDEDLLIQAVSDVVKYISGFQARLRAYERARGLLVHLDSFIEEARELIQTEEENGNARND